MINDLRKYMKSQQWKYILLFLASVFLSSATTFIYLQAKWQNTHGLKEMLVKNFHYHCLLSLESYDGRPVDFSKYFSCMANESKKITMQLEIATAGYEYLSCDQAENKRSDCKALLVDELHRVKNISTIK